MENPGGDIDIDFVSKPGGGLKTVDGVLEVLFWP